ncbi:hypothetical protein F511_17279 [Dorcoceras hygrometricum]|uniref:Uncharacterized protein n=1 Tax=Dorcoceras hygrometricum TaxID=472368 RepID=A0A2Z7CDV5_9LAMI|nr:hypothetical protein F511_17279 [Dorcoceras hygrometricum]
MDEMRRRVVIQTWLEGWRVIVSDLCAQDFACVNYSSELRMLELEDERVTPVYLISLLGSFIHYERSYHGFTTGRGVDPAGSDSGGG